MVFLRPNRLFDQATTGYSKKAPNDWTALIKPSQGPVGVPMNSCHCGKACRPFIIDPSYPLAEEKRMRQKMLKLSLIRCLCLYHGGEFCGRTAASSGPTPLDWNDLNNIMMRWLEVSSNLKDGEDDWKYCFMAEKVLCYAERCSYVGKEKLFE